MSNFSNELGLTRHQFYIFIGVSAIWFACCFALSFPPIRNLGIGFGEALILRPLMHPIWHERFIFMSITGIVMYLIIFANFFSPVIRTSPIVGKRLDVFAIAISLIIATFVIMFKANWVFGDDYEYIRYTAVNKYLPSLEAFDNGRFMPFRYIEYNLPLFIFRCLGINTGLPVEIHFAIISVFYIVTVLCLYSLFNEIEPVKTAGTYSAFNRFFPVFFFLLGSFSTIFMDIIFPETQVIMLFSFFMLMYYKALKTDEIRYYVAAFISALYSTYCKEPIFGLFLIIAFVNYLFKNKSKKENIFYIALIANGIIFITLYYFLAFKPTMGGGGFYGEGVVYIRGFKFLLSIFAGTPILVIMFYFGLIRFYSIIIKKEKDYLFYDSLLFAGIGYVFAFNILHLNTSYYFLPSIILFLPSLVHWIKHQFEKKRAYAVAFCFIILLPICTMNFGFTLSNIKGTWQDRQKFMPYIADLLSEYNNGKKFIWYESDRKIIDNTFYVRGWQKYTENAFLNYLNKSEGIDFFVVEKNKDNIDMNQNMLFFYSLYNDQRQPMQDTLLKLLQKNQFQLYKDSYEILIYK